MKPATQKRLFAWCVTAAIGAGLLSIYYYHAAGTVHSLAFGQAFAIFVVFTLVALLVALQPAQEAPAPLASPAPAAPPPAPAPQPPPPNDPAPRLADQTEHQSGQSRELRSAYKVGNQEVTTYNVRTSAGAVPFELIERTLEQVEVASAVGGPTPPVPMTPLFGGPLETQPGPEDAAPGGAPRIREVRHRLQNLVPAQEAEAGPPPAKGEPSLDSNGTEPPPVTDARHWKLRYEAERDALVKLWILYQDAEAELRGLRAPTLPSKPATAPTDRKSVV